jgi:hypothetical protein
MTFLERVCQALETNNVPYAVVGGHAVALHGAVRGTVDIDYVIRWSLKNLVSVEEALNSIGLQSRLPISADDIYHYRDEYIKNRNLLAWTFYNPSDLSEQVDVLINYDLTGKKTQSFQLSNQQVRVLNKKDLIKMKLASGRPQDLEDVAALEKLK